ncbi:MAG: hypothetical protein ACYC35_03275 [Pirellulales bacterium]
MNGFLAKVGVEQLVLLILALAAVLAVLANFGGAFWIGWLGVAISGLAASRWQQRRLVTGMD